VDLFHVKQQQPELGLRLQEQPADLLPLVRRGVAREVESQTQTQLVREEAHCLRVPGMGLLCGFSSCPMWDEHSIATTPPSLLLLLLLPTMSAAPCPSVRARCAGGAT
jgi:hypothetical protein